MFDMIGNVILNLFSSPATRKYPKSKRAPFERTRGKVGINIEECIFCGICQRKCPADSIQVDRVKKSWSVDPFKCIICGACEEVCPKKCIFMEGQYKAPAEVKERMGVIKSEVVEQEELSSAAKTEKSAEADKQKPDTKNKKETSVNKKESAAKDSAEMKKEAAATQIKKVKTTKSRKEKSA